MENSWHHRLLYFISQQCRIPVCSSVPIYQVSWTPPQSDHFSISPQNSLSIITVFSLDHSKSARFSTHPNQASP